MKKIKISDLSEATDLNGLNIPGAYLTYNQNRRVDLGKLHSALNSRIFDLEDHESTILGALRTYERQLYVNRNLLLGTNQGAVGWSFAVERAYVDNYTTYAYDDHMNWGATAKQCVLDDPAANRTPWEMFSRELRPELIKQGWGYRLSFRFDHDNSTPVEDFKLVVAISNANASQRLIDDIYVTDIRRGANRISVRFVPTASGEAGGTQKLWFRIGYNKDTDPSGSRWQAVAFSDVRLVVAEEETPWQPAPEDLGLPSANATFALRRRIEFPPIALPDDFQMTD